MEVNVEVWEMKEGKITAIRKEGDIYRVEEPEETRVKMCDICKIIKPTKDFYANKKSQDGLDNTCIECKKTKTKKCTKCEIEKDIVLFDKNRSAPDGLQSWCKECRRAYEKNKKKEKEVKKMLSKPKKKRERKLTTREKHWAKQIIEKFNDGVFHRKQELYDFVHKKIPYVQRQSMQVMVSRIMKAIGKNTKYDIETKRDPDDPRKYLFKLSKTVPDIKISNGSLPLTQPDTADRKKINWSKFRWK
jgi:hypothetical protein